MFGDSGSLRLPVALVREQIGLGASGGMGDVPRHVHMHMHAYTRMKH